VEAVSQDIGSQVQEVRVPADGVPISGVVRVIPARVNAAEALFRATAVVPIYVELEFAALSPVFVPVAVHQPVATSASEIAVLS
jgi:hypothetical protein